MQNYIIRVEEKQQGLRLDVFLSQYMNQMTRNKVQKLIKQNLVTLSFNNKKIIINDCNYKVKLNEEYIVEKEVKDINELKPLDLELDILYEDNFLLVINKPAGLVVHPGAGNLDNTLVNILVSKYGNNLSSLGGVERKGIVHRLDKNTSGVLVIAKTDYVHSELSKQFAEHSITRKYRALVWGIINPKKGTIDNIIARSSSNRQKMEVIDQSKFITQGISFKEAKCNSIKSHLINNYQGSIKRGKRAITEYNTIKISSNRLFSLIDCTLYTGRTHQIRVHMSYLGHPVVEDQLYCSKKVINSNLQKLNSSNLHISDLPDNFTLKRHALHAYKLEFVHPISNKIMNFEINEDEELLNLYSKLLK